MIWVSFAWTTEALPCYGGHKDVTRRDWKDEYARRIRPGTVCGACSKSFRFGGRPVGTIRVVSCARENVRKLLDDRDYGARELVREGGLWASVEDFVLLFTNRGIWNPYRLEFQWIGGLETVPAKFKRQLLLF